MFDSIACIAEDLTALGAAALDEVGSDALAEAITALNRLERRVAAQRLRVVAEHDRRAAWKRDGARSEVEWLRDACGIGHGEAAGQVEVARTLEELPRTADGFTDGDLGYSELRLATRAARGVPRDARPALDQLVTEVTSSHDRNRLRDRLTDFQQRHHPQSLAERERRAQERRRLDITSNGVDGGALDGWLPQVGIEVLSTALASVSAPAGPGDVRTPTQRRADGLVEIVQRAMAAGVLPEVSGYKPHVSLVADVRTADGGPESPAPTLDRTGATSIAVLERLLCDAAVSLVLMDGPSHVLDVGRERRTATAAQRRPLAARDGGCIGCRAPAGWCDAHHIVWWRNGGRTDLDNLVLLCWTCHDDVHHRGARVIRDEDGRFRLMRRRAGPPRGDS